MDVLTIVLGIVGIVILMVISYFAGLANGFDTDDFNAGYSSGWEDAFDLVRRTNQEK